MPATITPVDTYPASFETFADGEAISQANFVDYMQEFADAINYLRNRAVPSGGITVPAILHEPASNGGPGSYTWDAVRGGWNEGAGAGDVAVWPVAMMPSLTGGASAAWELVLVRVVTVNITGHGGLNPAAAQDLSLDYTRATDGSVVNVTSFSDPSTGAVLDTVHEWTSGALTHDIVDGGTYAITFTGESGANAQPDTVIKGVYFDLEPA